MKKLTISVVLVLLIEILLLCCRLFDVFVDSFDFRRELVDANRLQLFNHHTLGICTRRVAKYKSFYQASLIVF